MQRSLLLSITKQGLQNTCQTQICCSKTKSEQSLPEAVITKKTFFGGIGTARDSFRGTRAFVKAARSE